MFRLLLSLNILFLLFYLSVIPVRANADVNVASETFYRFNDSGLCEVDHQLTLTNGPSHVYPSTYQMDITGVVPEDLSVFSGATQYKYFLEEVTPQNTRLIVYLPDPVVGRGNSRQFTIRHRCLPAVRRGQLWEITLPRIEDINFYDRLRLKLQVPESFGLPAFIDPQYASSTSRTYVFEKNMLNNTSVHAVFGKFQVYRFSLDYPLSNTSSRSILISVPIPADSSYQKISYTDFSSPPQNVRVDDAGNWLADIRIPAHSDSRFRVTGFAYILPNSTALSVKPVEQPSEREVIGYANGQLLVWKEHWDPLQFTWNAPGFTPDRLFISTKQNAYYSLVSRTKIILESAMFTEHVPQLPHLTWQKPIQLLPFMKNHTYLEVSNPQPQAVYWLPVTLSLGSVRLVSSSSFSIPIIPPHGKVTVPVDFYLPLVPRFTQIYLSVRLGNDSITYNVPGYLFIIWHAFIVITISAIFILMAKFAVSAWSLHLQRQHRENNLRRQGQKSQKPG